MAFVAFVASVALSAFAACVASGTTRPEALIFAAVTAPFLIFEVETAFFLSCFVPTLFAGRAMAA